MGEPTVRCLYCGGSQSAEHPTCSTCGAVARFVTCAACKAKVPAGDEKCSRCGAAIQPGAATDTAPPCPRCRDHVLVLRRLADVAGSAGGTAQTPGVACALQCESCHGCFVRVRDWSVIVDDAAGGHPVDTTELVVPGGARLTADQLAETTRCPACRRDMDRFHFGVNSPAVVDVCETHGMWLDAGELATVLSVAADVAKTGHLPPESSADQAADAALHARLQSEEAEVDRNAEIARANFRAVDPNYARTERLERWGEALNGFAASLPQRFHRR